MAQEIYHRSNWGNPTETWGNTYLIADLTNELYKRASEYENSWVTDQLLNGVGIKPSIILTPTAYEDGVLNSVKPQRSLGSELVTNGTFDTDTNWTKGAGWTISGGTANYADSSISPLYQNITLNISSYELKFTISNSSGNGASIWIGNSSGSVSYTDGTYQYYTDGDYTLTINVPSSQTTLTFYGHTQGSSFSIDNVSVKEIIDADFDFTRGSSATRVNEQGLVEDVQILSGELVQNGDFEQIGSELVTNGDFSDGTTGWTINGDSFTIVDGALRINRITNTTYIQQNVLTSGKKYKVEFDVLDKVDNNGTFIVRLGSNNVYDVSTYEGTRFSKILTSSGIDFRIYSSSNDGVIYIDNVSVKEVGQNWTFGTGWSMGDGKAISDGSANNDLRYETTFNPSILKIKFDVNDLTQGSVRLFVNTPTFTQLINATSNGSYETTVEVTSGANNLYFYSTNNFIGSIDNVSVIEITDDTDLPRINYTNFDYEDVLGDELASPLDFTSDWTSTGATSITENSFQTSGSGIGIYFSLEADKKYKIKVSNVSGDISIRYRTSNGGAGTVAGNFDEFIIINTFGSTTPNIYLRANSETTVTVGDVTIKELTEDVVVPYSGEGSLLLENQSTNLVPYSEDLSQLSTVTSGGTVTETANFSEAPNGKNEATRLQMSSASGYALKGYTIPGFNDYFYVSVYLKSNTTENQEVAIYGRDSVNQSYTVTPQWQRFEVACDSRFNSSYFYFGVRTAYGSDADIDISAWGVQAEQGTYATSYIPTNGSTVTRLADVCNNSGNTDLINSTEGVLFVEASFSQGGRLAISNSSFSDQVVLGFSGSVFCRIRQGNSNVITEFNNANQENTFYKIAIKYKSGEFAVWVDGVEVDTNTTSFALTNLSQIIFTSEGNPFYGNVKCVAVFKEALSDTELEKLTTI